MTKKLHLAVKYALSLRKQGEDIGKACQMFGVTRSELERAMKERKT